MNYIYLQEWVPSVASHYFWMDGGARRLDHFCPKLTNSKQDLVEYPTNSLNGSPEGLVDNPKPLVVPNNMEEHCNLFLH